MHPLRLRRACRRTRERMNWREGEQRRRRMRRTWRRKRSKKGGRKEKKRAEKEEKRGSKPKEDNPRKINFSDFYLREIAK
jgi:hypothetical protein